MAKNSSLRVPPQSIESEQALLGSILLKPDGMIEAVDLVTPDSFYAEKHKIIYQAMLHLFDKHEPIDLVTLASKLREKDKLENIGGSSYLAELANAVPSSANLRHYAEVVRQKAILRGLIQAGVQIEEASYDPAHDFEHVIDLAEKKLLEVTSGAPGTRRNRGIKEGLKEVWEDLERLSQNKNALLGVASGFRDLDEHLSGLQKGHLLILAARPGMGKTTLALDIARNAAVQAKTPVAVFSLEMTSSQLFQRMLAAQSRVSAKSLSRGHINTEEEFGRLRDAMDVLAKSPIYVEEHGIHTINEVRSTARQLKSRHNIGLLVVDYLQLLTTARRYDSKVNEVSEISRGLKLLAKELNIPVLALSQLNRQVESRGGKPRLSDLRDSGSIEQDADVVMFIHRDDKNEDSSRPNIAEIIIEKHRHGPNGRIELYFDGNQTTFLSLDKNRQGAEQWSSSPADDF